MSVGPARRRRPGGRPLRGQAPQVVAVEADQSRRGPQGAVDAAQQRRLAAAVGSDETDELAGFHDQVGLRDDRAPAELDGDILQDQLQFSTVTGNPRRGGLAASGRHLGRRITCGDRQHEQDRQRKGSLVHGIPFPSGGEPPTSSADCDESRRV
jgi:hypothetical protein